MTLGNRSETILRNLSPTCGGNLQSGCGATQTQPPTRELPTLAAPEQPIQPPPPRRLLRLHLRLYRRATRRRPRRAISSAAAAPPPRPPPPLPPPRPRLRLRLRNCLLRRRLGRGRHARRHAARLPSHPARPGANVGDAAAHVVQYGNGGGERTQALHADAPERRGCAQPQTAART